MIQLTKLLLTPSANTQNQKEFICDPENISNGFCNSNQTGQFLLAPNATEKSISQIYTGAVHLNNTGPPINYPIKKTGYYCVGTTGYSPSDVKYTAVVEFRNAYGELPAAQIPKLPFYGIITIVYAVIGMYVIPLLQLTLAWANSGLIVFGHFSTCNIEKISVSILNQVC